MYKIKKNLEKKKINNNKKMLVVRRNALPISFTSSFSNHSVLYLALRRAMMLGYIYFVREA